MRAHTKGRDVQLVFEEDVGAALTKACELDSDNDVVHLARAAQTVRRHMFEEGEPFNGFPEGYQEDYVPSLLLALVSMVQEGSSIRDQMADTTPAALAIAQMLKFNCIKHNREHPTTGLVTARHSAAQENPVPTYVGMMLHAHTRKRELVDRLSHLGMSVSYIRVLELSAQMGNSACQQFHREQVVCFPKMHSNVFTTTAIDNIDHNPSSTTAKGSFHGTAISLLQYPSFNGKGVDRSIAIVGGSREASSKMVGRLPHYYTDVHPVTTNMKNISVPATSVVSLTRDSFKEQTEEEYVWLEHPRRVIEDNTGTAAVSSNHQPYRPASTVP